VAPKGREGRVARAVAAAPLGARAGQAIR